jgi:hypothetical protein
MRRTRISWLVIGGVALILAAAVVDALRPSGSSGKDVVGTDVESQGQAAQVGASTTRAGTTTTPLPRCGTEQVAVQVEMLSGSAVLELAHVSGGPCTTPRLPVEVRFFDRTGNQVRAYADAFAPTTLSPNVDVVANLYVIYRCRKRELTRFVVEAGRYVGRGRLPTGSCLDDRGP